MQAYLGLHQEEYARDPNKFVLAAVVENGNKLDIGLDKLVDERKYTSQKRTPQKGSFCYNDTHRY